MTVHDIAIIGAGIAGASLAYRLAPHAQVILLEAESQPGYHSTGRSAAMFMETYGTPSIQALTRASRRFYESPPLGFTDLPLLSPRGALYVATPQQASLLEEMHARWSRTAAGTFRWIGADEANAMVPVLRPELLHGALCEKDALDLDVHTLHQGFLREARRSGAQLRVNARLELAKFVDGIWILTLDDGQTIRAKVVVNAAGAWADVVAAKCAVKPVGLEPRRRSAFTFDAPPDCAVGNWPAVIGIDESYYFKPDAGQLLGSSANADPVEPHDVLPEEIDVATGIDQIETATTLTIRRPRHVWAGLRSFVADGDMVIGWDDSPQRFFWLVAQGGYGIQTAAAVSELAATLLLGLPVPEEISRQDFDLRTVTPSRMR